MSEETIQDEERLEADESALDTAQSADELQAAAPDGEEPSLEEQLAEARAEAARNLDGWQRTQAEFANARKRLERERSETYWRANNDMVSRLLPVIDDFERALETVPAEIVADNWYSGIDMVHRKLMTILENMNVEIIEAVGTPFDPNFHEALSQEPTDEYESGIVTRELQKGYKVGDRVIRPALVYVAE